MSIRVMNMSDELVFSDVELNPSPVVQSGSWWARAERTNVDGVAKVYSVTGPHSLQMDVLDVELENGDRWLVAGERFTGPKWVHGQLKDRLRITIQRMSGKPVFDLTIPTPGRRNPEAYTPSKAVAEELLELDARLFDILSDQGAEKIGAREELYDDQSSRRRYLSVIMSEDDCLAPVIAFVVTRVVALFAEYDRMCASGEIAESVVSHLTGEGDSLRGSTGTTALIAGGESDTVEFKSSIWFDYNRHSGEQGYQPKKEGYMQDNIIKSVAGFLNTRGGVLFIGVDDSGASLGLDNDVQLTKRRDMDSLEKELNELLAHTLGIDTVASKVTSSPQEFRRKTIWRIDVEKANSAVLAKTSKDSEAFFVRNGNATIKMSVQSMLEYIKSNWVSSEGSN